MTTEVKHKTGPTMKGPLPPSGDVALAPDPNWRPIKDAPRDGTYIYLKEDDTFAEWYWYKTRHYYKGSWTPTGWWRQRLGPKQTAHFIPTAFRLVADGFPK